MMITRPLSEVRGSFRSAHALRGLILVLISALAGVAGSGAETPVTPNASPEVQSLMAYLSDVNGRKILSGQQEGWRGTNVLGFELMHLTNTTGKLPALLGLDFIAATASAPTRDTGHLMVKNARDWYLNRNGIVSFCWHWCAPTGTPAFYSKDTAFDLRQGMIEGTPEHAAILRDLDAVAGELAQLRDARVPVLWRPMHEVNGRWFWWGARGPEPYQKLWRLMFNRFTRDHGLTNLIWVFSPGAATDLADWYPGDEYVDLIGQDHYPMDGNNGPARDVFDELVALGRGTKLVGMSENGPIPDPDRLVSEKAGWLFFTTWTGRVLTERNSKEQLIKVFNHPHVVNLSDLPDLKKYPFQPAGKPVKLGFPAPPGDVAIGGLRRQPVTVAVQDEAGRIVREGAYTVALGLEPSPAGGKIEGVLTVSTVNGVAVFPQVILNQPGTGCVFAATATGLKRAVSKPFEVGPGAGLTREWWTNVSEIKNVDLATLSRPASGRTRLTKAFESPVDQATGFAARCRGYVLAPRSGSYTFWIANDGLSELWLSTDAAPGHKVKIAEITGATPYVKWPHTHEVQSVPVILEAGKRYYFEVLQKQESGSTHLSVRWRLPDGREERPIPGSRLAPFLSDESDSTPRTSSSPRS